jgi:hypothetical protein
LASKISYYLRKYNQTEQNQNQSNRKRTVELPENCGIKPEDIPKNIWYMKPNGKHGDRFVVEVKGLPEGKIEKKSCSSKNIELITKLEQAKLILNEIYEKYPSIKEINSDNGVNIRNELRKSFNEIIKLSTFSEDVINKNLIELEEYTKKETNHEILEKAAILFNNSGTGNNHNISKLKIDTTNNEPEYINQLITKMPIIKFQPESNTRGCFYYVNNTNKKSSQSKKDSQKLKFCEILIHLQADVDWNKIKNELTEDEKKCLIFSDGKIIINYSNLPNELKIIGLPPHVNYCQGEKEEYFWISVHPNQTKKYKTSTTKNKPIYEKLEQLLSFYKTIDTNIDLTKWSNLLE